MIPRRRYRLLLVVAATVVFLLYRAAHNHEWDGVEPAYEPSRLQKSPPSVYEGGVTVGAPTSEELEGQHETPADSSLPPQREEVGEKDRLDESPAVQPPPPKAPEDETAPADSPQAPDKLSSSTSAKEAAVTTAPETQTPVDAGAPEVSASSSSRVHWRSFPEHFPVAEEDYILLPTGTPKPIPKIQFDFPPEERAAKAIRETRLADVKREMVRAWQGYRAFAWMHDELSPVSKFYRDPFCGWAATLVDGLDTLWIMGLKEEFDEAAKAVQYIDFTYSEKRSDIPVFETTIRYLGGLLAAYDVSGGEAGGYGMLLKKAEELAEILMGAFDTPNRMPVLYYQWQPEYVQQQRRASVVNVAEIGTLLMEFTRLSQLTGKEKYYDAVARITNAFEELQKEGTALDGIFPESLDASGCNRTATNIARQEAYEAMKEQETETSVAPPEETGAPGGSGESEESASHISKRGFREENARSEMGPRSPPPPYNPWSSLFMVDLDCVKQPNLVPSQYGYQSYSMGGSQDSTYEYFPKEYALLGGLEPKYRTLHENTVAAVKKWLLYRPMLPKGEDILFSAKLSTAGHPEVDANRQYEVPHLTCFLGGMFALGAKVFGLKEDLDFARRLTDGCVWAYGATPSGIMPEGSTMVPCEDLGPCAWNETLYYQHLDPQWEYREQQVADYYANQEEIEKHLQMVSNRKEAEKQMEEQEQERERVSVGAGSVPAESRAADGEKPEEDIVAEPQAQSGSDPQPGAAADENVYRYPRPEPGSEAPKVAKRGVDEDWDYRKSVPESEEAPSADSVAAERAGKPIAASAGAVGGQDASSQETANSAFGAESGQVPLEDPNKPLTHLEYVKQRIEHEKIPTGFVRISSKRYILRPEAIESVWYMYRITGDPIWQEKGWKMWQSVSKAVRTDVGASALDSVLEAEPAQSDEMESFWVAETLKYFYLLFATPDVVSLDEWVLNTEAHPFRRPDFKGKGV
ncbi:related to class I alpha-mannosidase 1A [Cephalotrichum gorgonifer]|uniref:alpha-1,2-Mannosidase n=1 Tax=Cephalotrichum gorgonifer TaxID=2041049 RepID=A0AAE8SX31_9PEZI|nr:related to class I alpha-mannosidase 1A [Cephalotrichum gorgonifer]